jgi:hypothetical protein
MQSNNHLKNNSKNNLIKVEKNLDSSKNSNNKPNAPDEANFEKLNEQEEKVDNEEKVIAIQLGKIDANPNAKTDIEEQVNKKESTDCTENKIESTSKSINEIKNTINNFNQNENTRNHQNIQEFPKLFEKEKDVKEEEKTENLPNFNDRNNNKEDAMSVSSLGNDQNNNKEDAMSISSLGKNDNAHIENLNEENVINTVNNYNIGNLSEENQNNIHSSQLGICKEDSLKVNNIQDNQNENIFLERVTENNEFPDPEPFGETTYYHTYNDNSNNIQMLGMGLETNAQDSLYDSNEEEFNILPEYQNYYEGTNDSLSPDSLDAVRNISSNH